MTYEEALKVIKENLAVAIHDWDDPTDENQREQAEGFQKAKEALEKQIPKKPNIKRQITCFSFRCPDCNRLFINKCDNEFIVGEKEEFCCKCGQHIDWSDEK